MVERRGKRVELKFAIELERFLRAPVEQLIDRRLVVGLGLAQLFLLLARDRQVVLRADKVGLRHLVGRVCDLRDIKHLTQVIDGGALQIA